MEHILVIIIFNYVKIFGKMSIYLLYNTMNIISEMLKMIKDSFIRA